MSDVTGVEANHSSTVRSTEHTQNRDHAQADDVLNDVPVSQDPNLSGTAPTEQLHPWRSGAMSAWQENDDYREFFEAGQVAYPSIKHRSTEDLHDGDYDDNRGIPLAIGEVHGYPGEPDGDKNLSHGDLPSAHEFSLGAVIVRRI